MLIFFYHHSTTFERSDNILPRLAYHYRIRKAHYVWPRDRHRTAAQTTTAVCYQTSKTTLIAGSVELSRAKIFYFYSLPCPLVFVDANTEIFHTIFVFPTHPRRCTMYRGKCHLHKIDSLHFRAISRNFTPILAPRNREKIGPAASQKKSVYNYYDGSLRLSSRTHIHHTTARTRVRYNKIPIAAAGATPNTVTTHRP